MPVNDPRKRIQQIVERSSEHQLATLRSELEESEAKRTTLLDEFVNVKASISAKSAKCTIELASVRKELEDTKAELDSIKYINETLRANIEGMSIELKKYQETELLPAPQVNSESTPKADKKPADKKPK